MQLAFRAAAADDAMELYASGFNAWNQLIFEPSMIEEEPDDLHVFTKVLGAQTISRPLSHLCYTVVHCDESKCLAGSSPSATILDAGEKDIFDHIHAISADGAILIAQDPTTGDTSQSIARYPSASAWKSGIDGRSWPCKSPVRQMAAYDAGFVILHEDASVSTLGDVRFGDCLGREVDESSPADEPGVVSDLGDLGEPVKKVVAGGYSVAALTEGGSLYLWGAESSGSRSRHQTFSDITRIPNYVEVDRDKDVEDVALGESHGIALTTDGRIYVIGDNNNGQLGAGRDFTGIASSWTKVEFKAPTGWKVVGVEAGLRSSFILTAKSKPI
ncbi:regulator of chromosome condensation 1/beta-lactamase-inhibitor protein II [Ilyonectria robusta]|uniref:regulator of chromosome condensation 1/beta-lactamase-inhibitor protein II n=1 Tax=Ilyonectria robusta TaxID=1079257 RepID=UPI001E8CE196|nr:regulator of chromosome condensation 1/beta-lactamase-inhibitor protein II [Ilyonectria robusta]KAH8706368.1 regulator of chromosome condensation 1/beta-lactamase-inhibitor protein II [Ilyonectria robusta]